MVIMIIMYKELNHEEYLSAVDDCFDYFTAL